MTKKQPGRQVAPPPPPTPPDSRRPLTPVLLVALALAVAGVAVFIVRSGPPQGEPQSAGGAAPPGAQSASGVAPQAEGQSSSGVRLQPDPQAQAASAASPAAATQAADPPPAAALKPHPQANLPALPFVGVPPARPIEVVRSVFQFAAEHPEVLTYVPCYCGCESQGHRGSEDCFVASRDAKGDVGSWEPHGMT